MEQPTYSLVYDVSQEGVWIYAIRQGGIFAIAAIAGICVFILAIRKRRRDLIMFTALWITVWIGIGGSGIWNVVSQRSQCISWLQNGDFAVIDGNVSEFKPMPYTGHSVESFTVNGTRFQYSDYDLSTGGFNNTTSHGGPIHEGLHVRIAHRDGRILRLEIGK